MNALLKRFLPLLLCAALMTPSFGQGLNQLLQPPGEAAKSGAGGAVDPLGRQTPNGTLFGFLQATQAGNYGAAALYLQMSPARRESQGEQVANELKAVLDRAFVGSLRAISNSPEGTLQPGFPADREKIGVLSIDDTEVDVILVRVNDANAGKVWLFSSDTLSRIHDVYELVESHRVETHVPQALVRIQFAGMSVWMWLALFLGAPIAAGLAWVLIQIFELPRILWLRHRKQPATLLDWRSVSAPVWLVLGVMIHRILVSYIGMPLLHRHYYYITARVVLVVGFSWLVLRLLARGLEKLRIRAIARGSAGTGSLVLLGQRVVKVVVVLFAGLTILGVLGFNMTTALAGLGIGGLAIGFGAQKTIENLFGGVSLLGDEVIRVGESCNFNGRVGTIEDISLRSTRIRTVERTELSIPNGTLATMSIENFSRRDKILFNPKIGLRYETTPDQLRYVLANARRMLYEHPKVETSSARIRLASLDDSWLTLEVFSYVLTRDYAEFTAIREDILLRMIDIINESGAGFAFPSQTLYLGRDSSPEKEKVEQAVESVKKWREEGKLPFPDFAPHEVSEFRDSLPYPPPESAVKDQKR
jgi:MscS family membrane protein